MNTPTKNILSLCLLGATLFVARDSLAASWTHIRREYFPCTKPITYQIGSIDNRFGISQQEFLRAIDQAQQVWEAAANTELFSYRDSADLEVNFPRANARGITEKLTLFSQRAKLFDLYPNHLDFRYSV